MGEVGGNDAEALHRERLSVPWWSWALWLGFVLVLVAIFLQPTGALPTAVLVLLLGGGAAAALLRWGSAHVVVTRHDLVAGRARIPVELTGRAVALDAERSRELRGARYEPTAYHLLRGWLPRAVVVEILDPDDPTPYWYVSSRDPEHLAAALDQARTPRR